MAGGFGFGAVQQRAKKKGEGDDDEYMDWNEAVRQDKVLKTQTLGGQYPDTDEVQYMVGVFQGKNLHLTPVSSLVHLRPQLHHIDAATQQERNTSAAASKDAAGSASSAARAIHMTIKNTADGDSATTETMADRLRYVQTENWRKMRYTDENEEAAWEVYNDSLFLRAQGEAAEQNTAEESPEKGSKGSAEEKDLENLVPRFGAKWSDKKMLEAVSGIVKPEPESEPEPQVKPEPKVEPADEGRKNKARPRGGAAPTARRGGRAKAPIKAIDID